MCKLMCNSQWLLMCWCVDADVVDDIVLICWEHCVDVLMIVLMTDCVDDIVLMCWWLCWCDDDCVSWCADENFLPPPPSSPTQWFAVVAFSGGGRTNLPAWHRSNNCVFDFDAALTLEACVDVDVQYVEVLMCRWLCWCVSWCVDMLMTLCWCVSKMMCWWQFMC
jgi:hypothetical protein